MLFALSQLVCCVGQIFVIQVIAEVIAPAAIV
jgi:hypothetical protein